MATFLLVGLVFGWTIAVILILPLMVTVFAVRLYLKRHTVGQVVAGLLLGAFIIWFAVVVFGCFV